MKLKTKYRLFGIVALMIIIIIIFACCTKSNAEEKQVVPGEQLVEVIEAEKEPIVEVEYNQFDIIYEASKQWLNSEEIEVLTNCLYGEARGLDKTQQSAVIWCIFNRLDNGKYGKNVIDIATAKNQFTGYKKGREYKDLKAYEQCKELVIDIYCRWYAEQLGCENVGRTLPKDYLWFYGNGKVNKFRNNFNDKSTCWNWELESPYED